MQSFSRFEKREYLDTLVRFITRYKRLLVLTGAGCSTESGIPDYRDDNGDWKQQQPVRYQDFVRSEGIRRRYWARSMAGWKIISLAKPNPGHHALARLEAGGFIRQLVTQNVDGLHQKAGSRRVVDLHGRIDTVECLDCRNRFSRELLQQELEERNPDFRNLRVFSAPDGDAQLEGIDFDRFQIPACPKCSGTLKPSVVFFGESVPHSRVELAYTALQESNALLVAGSSLMVFSSYRFCRAAKEQHKPIVAVNLGRTRADNDIDFKVQVQCGTVLPDLTARLGLNQK